MNESHELKLNASHQANDRQADRSSLKACTLLTQQSAPPTLTPTSASTPLK